MAEGIVGVLFDENFSPKLVSILRHLGERGLETVVRKFGAGAKDEDWIPQAAQWGYVYVTLDRRQLKDERIAPILAASKVRAIFLPNRFSHSRIWDQAFWLLKHWKKIASEAAILERGQLRKVQWNGRIQEL